MARTPSTARPSPASKYPPTYAGEAELAGDLAGPRARASTPSRPGLTHTTLAAPASAITRSASDGDHGLVEADAHRARPGEPRALLQRAGGEGLLEPRERQLGERVEPAGVARVERAVGVGDDRDVDRAEHGLDGAGARVAARPSRAAASRPSATSAAARSRAAAGVLDADDAGEADVASLDAQVLGERAPGAAQLEVERGRADERTRGAVARTGRGLRARAAGRLRRRRRGRRECAQRGVVERGDPREHVVGGGVDTRCRRTALPPPLGRRRAGGGTATSAVVRAVRGDDGVTQLERRGEGGERRSHGAVPPAACTMPRRARMAE